MCLSAALNWLTDGIIVVNPIWMKHKTTILAHQYYSTTVFFSWSGAGGANYKSKGGTLLPRVGPHSQGWDPDHKGRTRSPGYDTFKKIIVF